MCVFAVGFFFFFSYLAWQGASKNIVRRYNIGVALDYDKICDNRSEFLGLAGMVTITNHAESEGFDGPPTSDISQIVTQDTVDGGKRFSSTDLA